ncbi:YlbF family regulator [Cohnella sp. CFH 77786]|uniref:YlbF family regulator n=1 Tax=Cohnella sp. CFH 77786 TaxID=2662265 RepID=UPI001C60D540|nr:YlbF family regulator [Cohnella sp. CFH 77786]MBW5444689.1 YlbF family regulator [Cohnella sp. CFH 77786]
MLQRDAGEGPADWTELLSRAYTLGEMIKQSAMAEEYVYWKRKVENDEEAAQAARRLFKAKEKFAECERFGRFHPDYHEALDKVYAVQAELDRVESVRRFKAAERDLDELFREISVTVARAVSESVKVPDADPGAKGGGCGGGGSCSCGSGGCG